MGSWVKNCASAVCQGGSGWRIGDPWLKELTRSRRQQKTKKKTKKLSLSFFPQDSLSLCTIEDIVSKMTLGQILKIIKVILPWII